MSEEALDTEDESVDPTFTWTQASSRMLTILLRAFVRTGFHTLTEMTGSLWEFLCFQLSKQLGFGETRAAELTGMMIGNSEKTVHEWRTDFLFFF